MKDSLAGLQKSNPKLYADLSGKIDNATSWADIRSAQQPFVKVGQAARAASTAANKAPGVPIMASMGGAGLGLVAGGPVGGLIGAAVPTLAKRVISSPAVERAGAGVAGKAANVLARIGSPLVSGPTASAAGGAVQAAGNSMNNQAQGDTGMAPPATNPPAAGAGTTAVPDANAGIFNSLINPGGGTSANYAPIALQALMGMFDPNLLSQYSGAANTAEGTINKAQQALAAEQALKQTYGGMETSGGAGASNPLDRLYQMATRQSASPLAGGYTSQEQQLETLLKNLGAPTQAPSMFLQPNAANQQFSAIQQFLASLGAGANQPSLVPASQ
jgi:hypothetical protein